MNNSINKSIALSVLSSFWWMFDNSDKNEHEIFPYGSQNYVRQFNWFWGSFMSDLEDKNEELYDILCSLSKTEVREMAGQLP